MTVDGSFAPASSGAATAEREEDPAMSVGTQTRAQRTAGTRPSRIDVGRVAALYRQLLIELGEDPCRDGLVGTPERVAAWWSEFLDYEPGTTDTTFEYESTYGDLLVVGGISIYS